MKDIINEAIQIHKNLLAHFENDMREQIAAAAEMIAKCFRSGKTLYLCGNGGSAADCQRIAGEFMGRFRCDRKGLPAFALSADSSVLTCIGNDYSFDDVFKRQVDAVIWPGDILWAFSTSGSSENILSAVKMAKRKGGKILAFTGKPDSVLEFLADVCICAHCDIASASQEIHMIAYHIIADLVEQKIAEIK